MAKRRKLKKITGSETLNQIEHIEEAGARATIGPILAPGSVVTTDTSTVGVYVGAGSICRIQATADTYIAFGESNIAAVTSATSPAFKHPGGYILLNATDDFIRSSAALTRLEVVEP